MQHAPSSPIRIAFLGADADTLELAHAVVANNQFQLTGYCEVETTPGAFDVVFARRRHFDSWETLLDQQVVDAVVVARGVDEDRRADQLRKLIQLGMPLIVSHPVVDSMLVYYELDMIRRETGCLVLPYLSDRSHPAIQALARMTNDGVSPPLGNIEQVTFERGVSAPTKANVARQFARDVDLVRALAGDMTRLGAMAAGGESGVYTSLGVQMSGPRGIVARWSVDPLHASQEAQIIVRGSRGKAIVAIRPAPEPWTLETIIGGRGQLDTFDDWDSAAAALARLHEALQGAPPEPDWVDAARSVELAETIDRSLAKGRTIELYYEDYTEEGTFKGTMTSVGCGLLLLAMFALGMVAIAEQMGVPYLRLWPYLLAGTLSLFLLAQLLMLVFKKRDGQTHGDVSLPQVPD